MDLEIQVLGTVAVFVDGRPVELGPTRRRTLLAALAHDAGRVVSVDVLADRVWDGEPPANPVPTLHAYMSRLRSSVRRFGDDGTELRSPLITRAPGYVLDVPAASVDAHVFADEVDLAHAQHLRDDPAAAHRTIHTALSRWHGGEAYADVPARFARREAGRLAELLARAHELAAQVDLALGLHEQLVPRLNALLADQPLREGIHASLMLALYRSGRQADALAHHARLRELLRDELGVDPGPELRALHQQILRQDPALDPPAPVAAALLAADTAPAAAAPPAAVPVAGRIVGRERELARLHGLLDRAARGSVTPVAVVGEAGIGKTRLIEEAVASARGSRVAWGRCWQHEGAPVLWPWVQAVESLAEQLPAADLARALAGRGAGVTALVPALAAAAGGAPAEAPGPVLDRVRLYDAVAEFLGALSSAPGAAPVVLVLEDMHWADLASRELAEYVVGQLRAGRLAVLMSVRTPTDDSSRAGTELLTVLARSGRADRLDLVGLSPEAVTEYVADRTGSALDADTASALADRTGGNPFFVAELVRLLVTDGDAADPGAVPDSVREVISRRLSRLPDTDRTVLRVAAVVGRTFDLDLLVAASRIGEDEVDEAVDNATALGILCSEPGAVARHRFVHALTQQTLLETTGPARVRRLHGRVAEALETRHGGTVSPATAEQLAFHLARSGSEPELARAVDLCIRVADQAVSHGNYPEAESLLLRATDLTARLPPDRGEMLETTARVRLWLLYTCTGGPVTPEATGQHERAVELIRRHGGTREIIAGHQAEFSRLIWLDDLDGVEQLIAKMAAAAGATDDPLMRVAVRLARGQMLMHRGRLAEALAEYDALETLRDGYASVPAGVFPLEPSSAVPMWRSIVLTLMGREDDARRAGAEVLARIDGAPPTTVAYVQLMLSFRSSLVDDPEEAQRLVEAALAVIEEHHLVEAATFARPIHAWARERLRPGSALLECQAALDATADLPVRAMRPAQQALLADVSLRAGQAERALAAAEAGLAEETVSGDVMRHDELVRLRDAARAELRPPSLTGRSGFPDHP